jgi:phage FluMu protein Com
MKAKIYIWYVDGPRKKDIPKKLVENRCCNCGHMLMRSNIIHGTVERKCDKCGTLNTICIQPESRSSYQERLNLSHK